MYPILFSIDGVNLYTHGLLMVIGIGLGSLILYSIAKRKGYETKFLFDLIIYSVLGGLIGSRILYLLLYFNQFANWKEMLFIWYGGLVSYGGIIGGFLVVWAVLAYRKKPILEWFDMGIVGFMVGWGIGRVGCLLAGDSLGLISSSRIAIWGRIPTQLFESIWSIVVALICFWLLGRKEKFNLPDGFIFGVGLASYALGRFVVDFCRDDAPLFWIFKAGQIGSLVIFLLLAFILIVTVKRLKRKEF